MFPAHLYTSRRNHLQKNISKGILLFLGNQEVSYNYLANTYHFRQDSSFSYYFGLPGPNLAGLIDTEEGTSYIFGDNIDMEDIIWMGNLPSIEERAASVGISKTLPFKELEGMLKKAQSFGRRIHFLPPYRGESICQLEDLLGITKQSLKQAASEELIKAVVEQRLLKDSHEIAEIENMIEVAYLMHTRAMKMAQPGINEKQIAGEIEGIALSRSNGVSFPIILSMDGQTLHNHSHRNVLEKGRLLITDVGAESEMLYASDITRTSPVGGKFSEIQRNIYQIVLDANLKAIELTNPKITYREVHLASARVIAEGLKNLGLMKGNIDDAVENGAHALFFPHGLGHAMGMDVHDMEGLGENIVGYDETISRSPQFGLGYLRSAKKPKPGCVLTVEPGLYFIPELIDLWKGQKKFTDFINYEKLDAYKSFGGIRIEDDILVTENGCKVMGKPIPKTIEEIEATMAG